jgi:hypothetical protein
MKNYRSMPVEKVRCACGCYVGKYYLNNHKRTKKHQKLMEAISVPQQPTISSIEKEMEDLYEKMDEMSSGDYLMECNRLKAIYDNLRRSDYLYQRMELYRF